MTTTLLTALLAGKDGQALAAVAQGAPLDAQDDKGNTALMLAIAQGQNAVVRLLLDKGADTSLKNSFNRNAMDMAIDCGNPVARNMLFRRLDERGVQEQAFRAARNGDLEALTFLVEELGASLTARNSRNKTLLDEAEVEMQFETAQWLEEKIASAPDDAAKDMHKGSRKTFRPLKQFVIRPGG